METKKPKSWLKSVSAFANGIGGILIFGLADKNGLLTNTGKLLADQHIVFNSRIFCTRWNGTEKDSIFDDALDDKEYEGT